MFSVNLSLLSAGLIGMAFGLIPVEAINGFAMKWLPILALYGLYRLCNYYWESYPVQIFGAIISLAVLYACALRLNCDSGFGRRVVSLGKYSLVGYLAQIPLIQVLVELSKGKPAHWFGVLAVGLVTAALVFLIVQGLDALRKRSAMADRMYKAVFA